MKSNNNNNNNNIKILKVTFERLKLLFQKWDTKVFGYLIGTSTSSSTSSSSSNNIIFNFSKSHPENSIFTPYIKLIDYQKMKMMVPPCSLLIKGIFVSNDVISKYMIDGKIDKKSMMNQNHMLIPEEMWGLGKMRKREFIIVVGKLKKIDFYMLTSENENEQYLKKVNIDVIDESQVDLYSFKCSMKKVKEESLFLEENGNKKENGKEGGIKSIKWVFENKFLDENDDELIVKQDNNNNNNQEEKNLYKGRKVEKRRIFDIKVFFNHSIKEKCEIASYNVSSRGSTFIYYSPVCVFLGIPTIGQVVKGLKKSLNLQIMISNELIRENKRIKSIRFCNFKPFDDYPHIFTLWYSFFSHEIFEEEKNSKFLIEQREINHKRFYLSTNYPILRVNNSLNNSEGVNFTDRKLVNVHKSLSREQGEIIVKGVYNYYHYGMNRIDDRGYGCAYRSAQTIISWFVYSGFKSIEIPTIEELQKILVKIGDKKKSFIGSKSWIGGFEINLILNHLFEIDSKIVRVDLSNQLGEVARTVEQHFKKGRSPVYFGGDTLAWTVIGVKINKKSGGIRWLILNPHYEGGNDLKGIIKGNWVGWKSTKSIFKFGKAQFYHFLFPQTNKCI